MGCRRGPPVTLVTHCRACEGPLTPFRPGAPPTWCHYCRKRYPPDQTAEQTVREDFATRCRALMPEEA